MQKDVIYIDVEDDITAIISKVKNSGEKIVALVPPKRIGVLQSAVNLRLLERAASSDSKRLVIITSNDALQSLAASAKIPVARNLQSKPELAEISALNVDDGDDVIDGSELPVGDHARMGGDQLSPKTTATVSDQPKPTLDKKAPIGTTSTATKNIAKPKIKVPNFGSFRKKLLIGAGAGVALIGFLIWAIFFAPHATIYITAKTTDTSVNEAVKIGSETPTSANKKTLRATTQTIKKDVSIDFAATGEKDIGKKARGQVVFNNCESPNSITIPAGTRLTAAGKAYQTGESVTVPGGKGGFGGCSTPGKSDPVSVSAADIGDEYNLAGGSTFNVSGHRNSSQSQYFNATASGSISGGSHKMVKVVTAGDIAGAKQKLSSDADEYKSQLKDQFDDGVIILDQSFKVDSGDATAKPGQGEQTSNGKAVLSGSVTYLMQGVAKSEISTYLDAYFETHLEDNKEQRTYDNGSDKAQFNSINISGSIVSANLTATGKIGPKIDDNEIKNTAKGKRYGEIQSAVQSIQGVNNVDVKYSPFWVSSAPDDTKRISIKFNLDDKK